MERSCSSQYCEISMDYAFMASPAEVILSLLACSITYPK